MKSETKYVGQLYRPGNRSLSAANRHLGKSDREAAGVLSGAQRHTHCDLVQELGK